MYLFKGLIKCINCQGNFKSKTERGKRKYLCSNYDNKKSCIRFVVLEDEIANLILRHFNSDMINLEEIKSIQVDPIKGKITVDYTDNSQSYMSTNRYSV